MYGQGNFGPPRFGQSPQMPQPPPQNNMPPYPPHSFQHGTTPQSQMVQQGQASFFPALGAQSGSPMYPQFSVLPSGISNSVQSYGTQLPPPPPPPQVHQNVTHSFSSNQQNPQWAQNVHHIPSSVHPPPPGPPSTSQSGTEMLCVPPPPPPRVFSGQVHPPLPHPQTSSSNVYTTNAPFGSVVHPTQQLTGLVAPPPPPSSPPRLPPLPPSSPPPASSVSHFRSPDSLCSNQNANVDDIYKYSAPLQGGDAFPNCEFDLPPPPLKPKEERVARKIEVLCQYIARNGPAFEEKTRKIENGNPEFEFLFGGTPGSEAAVAHDYFIWMKKKCSLSHKKHEEKQHSDPSLRSFQFDNLTKEERQNDSLSRPGQTLSVMDAALSQSPVDSDMDMEDDITQTNEQLDVPQSVAEHSPAQDSVSGNPLGSVSLVSPEEKEEHLSPDRDHCSSGRSLVEVDCSIFNPVGNSGYTEINVEEVSTCPTEVVDQPNVTATLGDTGSEKVASHLFPGASAFKQIQDYASDDSSESDHELVSSSVKAGNENLDGEMTSDFLTDVTPKGILESEKGINLSCKSVVVLSGSMHSTMLASLVELQETAQAAQEVDASSIVKAKQPECDSHGSQESVEDGIPDKVFEEKAFKRSGLEPALVSGESHMEDMKCSSTEPKVDEFGRLVRKGTSDSESDDLRYSRTRGKRARSRSRSRSPQGRRKRSPRRRREKRSRSRSWSPKRRRSRSRSPIRRGSEYVSDRPRRDKVQRQDCFDYKRGKCYRGSMCRYVHHETNKSGVSRRYKSKYEEVPPSPKSYNEKSVHEHYTKSREMQDSQDMSTSSLGLSKDGNINRGFVVSSGNVFDEVKSQDMMISQDFSGSGHSHSKDCNIYHKEDVISARNVAGVDAISVAKTVRAREERTQSQKAQDKEEEAVVAAVQQVASLAAASILRRDADNLVLPHGNTCHDVQFSPEKSAIQQSLPDLSGLQRDDYRPHQMENHSDSPLVQASEGSQNLLPVEGEPLSAQSDPATGSASKPYLSQHLGAHELSPNSSHQPSQLPPPPPSASQAASASLAPVNYNMMAPIAGYSHPTSLGNVALPQAQLPHQHAHFSGPPNFAWNTLPPPPPRPSYVNELTAHSASVAHGVPSFQFQQTQVSFSNDYPPQRLVRPYLTDPPSSSHGGEFHNGTYPQMQGTSRPLSHLEEVNPARRMPSLGGDSQHSGDGFTSYSQSHSYLQQPSYSLQHPTDSVSVHVGEPGQISTALPSNTSNLFDANQPSSVSNFGGSRIPTYYNPYASTFEQPSSSKISSSVSHQGKDMPYSNTYNNSFSLNYVPTDGQGVGVSGSEGMTCTPNAVAGTIVLARSSGDNYDPLFDSIEQSSTSFRKSDDHHNQDSSIMLSHNGHNKQSNLVENTKQSEAGAVVLSASPDNDEYGETADAEVGAVENGSPSDGTDEPDTAAGEVEINQAKAQEKRKVKDSRLMKLFKVALADFVKEVLKPSWRQGNMSKEAFKTIVKKTVDKVSGAMKSHQVPKSKAKINHYIDSSQRKLTKLVMGYVDKYVKV